MIGRFNTLCLINQAKSETMNEQQSIALRPPATVMRLARMGSCHQTRLSFMRILLRRAHQEGWQFTRTLWDVNELGVGTALYQAVGPERTYTLVAFAHDLDPALRSDRVIAEAWDATFTLFDGIPTAEDVERLRSQVPFQEAGHISATELTLARANRSVRLFEHVRDCLAAGQQPTAESLAEVGYLMRTTAVYGSGKFGALDRRFVVDRKEFNAPFQAELLSVFLIRAFTVDIVEHMARMQAPDTAVNLAPHLRVMLGVGNSTGLGMAPFFINHPQLVHRWMLARETALARVRSLANTTAERWAFAQQLVKRLQVDVAAWRTDHAGQVARVLVLAEELEALRAHMAGTSHEVDAPWDGLYCHAEQHASLEAQELVVTVLIECHPELVDDLSETLAIDESRYFAIDGTQSIADLGELVRERYAFALAVDFALPAANARFWYVSEEKLEPRVGERFDEQGSALEHPLAIARDVAALMNDWSHYAEDQTVATLLRDHPEHRHVVRRVQHSRAFPYAEIHDNVIADDMMPIDILRCKLAYFGATKFDPRSDRWVRITMFQNAPFPDTLHTTYADDWVYPKAS